MKNLSDLFHRHDITKLQFVIACILTFIVGFYIFHALYNLVGWWILLPLGMAVFMFFFMKGTTPQQKKWVAIAPEKGEIASYLTNGKAYNVIRFHSYSDGERIISKKYGRSFFITTDNGSIIEPNEFESSHLYRLNWKLKQVNISKSDTKVTKN